MDYLLYHKSPFYCNLTKTKDKQINNIFHLPTKETGVTYIHAYWDFLTRNTRKGKIAGRLIFTIFRIPKFKFQAESVMNLTCYGMVIAKKVGTSNDT